MNGLSIAFYTGAYEAWLFNQKHGYEQESTYHVYSKSQEYAFIGIMMAGLCGAIFSSLAIYMSIAMLLITALVFMSCKETTKNQHAHLEIFKNTGGLTKEIVFVSMPPIFFGAFIQVAYQLWPAYMVQPLINASQKQLGFVFVSMMLGQFFLSNLSKSIKGLPEKRTFLVGISSLLLLCTLLMPQVLRTPSLMGLIFSGIFLVLTISFCAITCNTLFTYACDTFDNESKSTSISYLDALTRGIAATVLFAGYVGQTTTISFYWLIFLFLFGVIFVIQTVGFKRTYYAQRQSNILN